MTEKAYQKRLGQTIKAMLKVKKLRQAAIAEKIGKDAGQFSKMLNAKLKIYDDDLALISQAIGVSVDDLKPRDMYDVFDGPLAFEIAWAESGGGRHDSDLGRLAAAFVAFNSLNPEGQRKALDALQVLSMVPEYKA